MDASNAGKPETPASISAHDATISTNLTVETVPGSAAAAVSDVANSIATQHEQHILTLEPEEDEHLVVPEQPDDEANVVSLPAGVAAEQIEHVFVLAHGINGFSSDMDAVEKSIRKHTAFQGNTIILKSRVNQANKTHEGLEVAGMRLAAEIIEVLAAVNIRPRNQNAPTAAVLPSSNPTSKNSNEKEKLSSSSSSNGLRSSTGRQKVKLSICAHSLGGLISRNAIGHLEVLGTLDQVDCVSYVSLATPHFGSRRVGGEFGHVGKAIWKSVVHFAVSFNGDTGKQLILEDAAEPLLVRMTRPGSPYLVGLAKFRHRTCAGVTHNDPLVPFPGACIRTRNPYPPPAWNAPNKLQIESTTGFPLSHEPIFSAYRRATPLPPQFDISLDPFPGEATSKGLFCDHLRTVEYHPEMVTNLNSLPWRRIELNFGGGAVGLHFHEQVIKTKKHWKAPFLDEKASVNFVDLVAEMLALDHLLAL